MSYGGYNNQGYGGQGGYGQQGNRYDNSYETDNPYGSEGQTQDGYGGRQQQQQGGYPAPRPAQNTAGYGGYDAVPTSGNGAPGGGNDMEMGPMNGSGRPARSDPNAIRNECRDIDRGIEQIGGNLTRLRELQRRSLEDPNSSPDTSVNRDIDKIGYDTMTLYRNFAARIKKIKSQPESGSPTNAPHVTKTDGKLKTAINEYQNVERDFRRRLQAQMERQYRIVRPDASDAEVREAVEDTSNNQVFSQALLQSDRRGQAQSALRAVTDRHTAIQKIERQMEELAALFQDMEALVVQQEPMVDVIDQKGEETKQHVEKGNEELSQGVVKARAARRKKWWCLLICIIIAAIIAIVLGIIFGVVRK